MREFNPDNLGKPDTVEMIVKKIRKEKLREQKRNPEFDENLTDLTEPLNMDEETAEIDDPELRKEENQEFQENMDSKDDEIDDREGD